MILRIISGIIMMTILLIMQVNVLPLLKLDDYINLFLLLSLLLMLNSGLKNIIWWVLGGAVIIDFYTILPFGVYVF